MANVGFFFNTQIPDLDDDANIQDALKQYHYGGGEPANESSASIVENSIAGHFQAVAEKFADILEYYRTGGDFVGTEPTGTPSGTNLEEGIPDGYIWVDSSVSGGPSTTYYASVFYSNSEPTEDLSSGVVWVDKDSALKTAYVYDADLVAWIPINDFANAVSAKGDILVGNSATDLDSLSVGQNGYVLTADSTATLGVAWAPSDIEEEKIATIMGVY